MLVLTGARVATAEWLHSWLLARPIFMLMVPTLAPDGDMGGTLSMLSVTALPRRDAGMTVNSEKAC